MYFCNPFIKTGLTENKVYTTTIEFGSDDVTVDQIQDSIFNVNGLDEDGSLLLDFTKPKHILLESLMYLISFISQRKSLNRTTYIKYFSNENIRGFIHNSRFFETLKDVCAVDIRDFAIDLPEQFENTAYAVDYFDKPRYEYYNGNLVLMSAKDRLEHLKNKGFYPLTSLEFQTDIQKSYTLKQEPKNWMEGKPIISIIQKNLPDKISIGNKISKHIIYESITNAIRHPNSTKLVIACRKQLNQYTLVMWDNGESIIETLLNELKSGNSIKADDCEDDFHSCYCIEKVKKKGRPTIDNFDFYYSHDVPNLNEENPDFAYRKDEKFVLLSSLFPGISRDPKGSDYTKSTVLNNEEKPVLTGRGLTYLINTAVRNFGGEVRIRTGNYFMNIKKADKVITSMPDLFVDNYSDKYYVIDYQKKYQEKNIEPADKKIINTVFRAKISTIGEEHQAFLGNMITIQIPQ